LHKKTVFLSTAFVQGAQKGIGGLFLGNTEKRRDREKRPWSIRTLKLIFQLQFFLFLLFSPLCENLQFTPNSSIIEVD